MYFNEESTFGPRSHNELMAIRYWNRCTRLKEEMEKEDDMEKKQEIKEAAGEAALHWFEASARAGRELRARG